MSSIAARWRGSQAARHERPSERTGLADTDTRVRDRTCIRLRGLCESGDGVCSRIFLVTRRVCVRLRAACSDGARGGRVQRLSRVRVGSRALVEVLLFVVCAVTHRERRAESTEASMCCGGPDVALPLARWARRRSTQCSTCASRVSSVFCVSSHFSSPD